MTTPYYSLYRAWKLQYVQLGWIFEMKSGLDDAKICPFTCQILNYWLVLARRRLKSVREEEAEEYFCTEIPKKNLFYRSAGGVSVPRKRFKISLMQASQKNKELQYPFLTSRWCYQRVWCLFVSHSCSWIKATAGEDFKAKDASEVFPQT